MISVIFVEILMTTIQIKNRILIVFDDMIADILSNKNFNNSLIIY